MGSIDWLPPEISGNGKPRINVLNYIKSIENSSKDRSKKIFCDVQRICEVEDAIVEWYDFKYYQKKSSLMDLEFLKELF